MKIVKFEKHHIDEISEQETMKFLRPFITDSDIQKMVNSPHSFSVLVNDKAIASCGIHEIWKDRGEAWAILSGDCKKEFFKIHRGVQRYLKIAPFKRIEATVLTGFHAGHRWMINLGFEMEAPLLKSYFPNGADAALYAKVSS